MAYNILIVDDSAIVRAVIKKTLTLAGIDVGELLEAGNGKEGLAALEENWVDLVLADINMPEMNGIEMVEQMSENGLMETTPVIIISTEGSQTRVEELKAKGVRAYIRKPFTPELVKEVIDQVLGADNE
ncbi:MAG: response regulator [Candidatus Coatesbacteria bacterium]|nr:response regulator [Candidatus Coatesbacteria bacterium]